MYQRSRSSSRQRRRFVFISLAINFCLLIGLSAPFPRRIAQASFPVAHSVAHKLGTSSTGQVDNTGSVTPVQSLQSPPIRKGEVHILFSDGV
jgi:hypothetical protein